MPCFSTPRPRPRPLLRVLGVGVGAGLLVGVAGCGRAGSAAADLGVGEAQAAIPRAGAGGILSPEPGPGLVPIAAEEGLALSGPRGARLTLFAEGFDSPRLMARAPNGDIFLADTGSGTVYVLPDDNHDGRADARVVFARGLNQPHGLAFHPNGQWLYVADNDAVVRLPYARGQRSPRGVAPERVLGLPAGGGHSTRTIAFGPDGRLYASAGSSCNVCEESDPRRAAIQVSDDTGRNARVYATGLRNAVGIGWNGGRLFATSNGRDLLGDDIPPEGVWQVTDGGFYGWPYCLATGPGRPLAFDRAYGHRGPEVCTRAGPPVATVTAHSAPLGLFFPSDAARLPAGLKGGGRMLVALHGSWNRSRKSGYRVVSVDPARGTVTPVLEGFYQPDSGAVQGRPVGFAETTDGAILISDDGQRRVWRLEAP